MSDAFKPMLASAADMRKVRWPMLGSIKLDGIRATVRGGVLLSRSLKMIPNFEIAATLSKPFFNGLDGELIIGPANSPTCYRDTVSGVMAENKTGLDWSYWVFDHHGSATATFNYRYAKLLESTEGMGSRIRVLPQEELSSEEELDAFEAQALLDGHEGVMLRDPYSPYKFGRSTANEGYLLKVKRFMDGEAFVVGVIEEMHNGNVAETNELGRTKRSSHKENKTGKGRMGALLVRDTVTGIEFQIGTGFDDKDRDWWWVTRNVTSRPIVKYKHFPIGVKDRPRHPVYLGLRDNLDL